MTTTTDRKELPKTYSPGPVEAGLYDFWEQSGYFQPRADRDAPVFVITIPPPNVTGDLHLGHALTYSIEDVLGRYKRMQGFSTLILPGMDHASIAVHAKVEAVLAAEGVRRRFDIGREKFLERSWEWKNQYGAIIDRQFRALGEGYDWSRERFTMDPGYQRAVMTMFVRLYQEGYIYRGSRVINWCPGCQTGISDIEVRSEEREDALYYVRLPFSDGRGGITVATVRPETMFGDVAVAVHPEDNRYADAIGNHVTHPLTGETIPVIGDPFVDPKFGTGAVKITPAHDYADFEVGERHHLPMPVVITQHATMAGDVPAPFGGMGILPAREAALEQLRQGGFLVRTEPHVHNVPLCDRCSSVIEPLLSEQWFMRMQELAAPAIEVVKSGRVKFVPERWGRIYLEWMENIRPWNISRQLWWGHRIPIYHCPNGHTTASVDPPPACPECGSTGLTQDPDVLDTWFSSAIWPFATLGWPDETPDLNRYYPTSFMNTSSQILYLWIARMIMMGIHFMGEIPFPVVLINPTILNEKGQRMSKSLGTGIDPLETVDCYGADATRFGVFSAGSIMQQEIRFAGYERAEEGQRFANKIWNAARFVLQNLKGSTPGRAQPDLNELGVADAWILSRMDAVVSAATQELENLDLSVGLRALYDFFWGELADWYLEAAKLDLRSSDSGREARAHAILWSVLDRSVRLLHPYMPFITEEIWQHLRNNIPDGALALSGLSHPLPDSIMVAPWPQSTGRRDPGAEVDMRLVMDTIGALRNLRAEHDVKPKSRIRAEVVSKSRADLFDRASDLIQGLAGLESLNVISPESPTDRAMAELVVGEVVIRVPLSDVSNIAEERARVTRELGRLTSEAERLTAVVENPSFAAKAPERVVASERAKLETTRAAMSQLQQQLQALGEANHD